MTSLVKYLSILPIALVLLAAAGCAKSNRAVSPAAAMPIEPGVGLGPIKFGMAMEDLEKALGKPSRTAGGAQEYLRLGIAVLPGRDGKVAAIMMGDDNGGSLTEAFTGTTSDGIGMGASREKIVTTQGHPDRTENVTANIEVLHYVSKKTTYTLKGGKLVHIVLQR